MYSFPNLEPVYCSMSSSNCCFLTCIQISQEAGQVGWYSHLLKTSSFLSSFSLPVLLFIYFFFIVVKYAALCLVTQLCPTLCYPMDCSPPRSSVHGTLQARILEWVAMPYSRGSSQTRDQTQISRIAGGFFTI